MPPFDELLQPTAKRRPPPKQARRSEALLNSLKEDIISIAIKPGERLYESDVAERYATSRTPAREALMRLLEDGLVQRNGRAYVVESFSMDLIDQLYNVRECLETRALASFSARMTRDDILELKSLIREMQATVDAKDIHAFNKRDSAFHLALARMSGNRFLFLQIASLHDRVRMIRNVFFFSDERQIQAHEEHIRIVAALERQDLGVAQAEMRSHLLRAIELLRLGHTGAATGRVGEN